MTHHEVVSGGARVLLPELRDRGNSGHSDAYSVSDYLLDLHEVDTTLARGPKTILGTA